MIFEGAAGALLWMSRGTHEGGVLSIAVHPNTTTITTAGQNERVLFWSAKDGQQRKAVELGMGWIRNLERSSNRQLLAASISRRISVYPAMVIKSGSRMNTLAWSVQSPGQGHPSPPHYAMERCHSSAQPPVRLEI